MRSLYIAVTFLASQTAIANNLYDASGVDILLSNRSIITEQTVILDKNSYSSYVSNEIYSNISITALPKETPVGSSDNIVKHINILFKNNDFQNVVFRESGAHNISGEFISNVAVLPRAPIFLIETKWTSRGATGGGVDGKNLYIFMFNKNTIKKRKITLFEVDIRHGNVITNTDYSWSIDKKKTYLFLTKRNSNELYIFSEKDLDIKHADLPEAKKVLPSYNCSNVINKIEVVICKDPALATLDYQMANLYSAYKANKNVVNSQKQWLIGREHCNRFSNSLFYQCLVLKYENRIKELEKYNKANKL
jgi:hypothetical protein